MAMLSRECILTKLEKHFTDTALCAEEYINKIIQNIINNNHINISSEKLIISKMLLAKDIIGELYQRISPQSDKKNKGQFFTEPAIVSTIVQRAFSELKASAVEMLSTLRICDPACGSGLFLMEAYSQLSALYRQTGIDEHRIPLQIISNNLFAYDKDPVAVKIARFNLAVISGLSIDQITNICTNDFLYKDALSFSQKNIGQNRFDIIIGNPPWGSTLSSKEKQYYRQVYFSAKSGINTFSLFIERSLELLVEGGTLALLVPESLLNIDAHRNCRNLLITQTRIYEIMLWGDQFKNVYAPCISLITKKSETTPVADNIAKFILKNSTASIQQCNFFSTHNNIININYTSKEKDLLEQIQKSDHRYLKHNAEFFLGIVTGSNERFLSKDRNEETPDPIIIGKDVSRYSISYSGHHFKYDPKQLQQVAPLKYYEKKNKILYKFIGKRLSFAIDREGFFTLNNVNGFIPKFDWITSESLIAILNSTLMQYYYEKNFFTVKVLRGNLEKLPIKRISKEADRLLNELAQQVMEPGTEESKKNTLDTIDDIVFSEYDIEDKEAYHIYETYSTEKSQLLLPGL